MPTPLLTRPATPDWDHVRDRVGRLGWATTAYQGIVAETERWRGRLVVAGPDEPSAWTHHYFCDDDGTRLAFDPANGAEHRCPTCGRTYTDDLRVGAWRTTHHNAVAAQVERDAMIMLLDRDPEVVVAAREELQSILTWYGTRYAAYPEHGYHAGIGKVMPQSLDESIWAISLLRAVRRAEAQLDEATLSAAVELARGVAALLRPQVSQIHNIHCWMLGALAECALRLGDTELLEFTATSEFGAFAQLQQGFRPEGLWFEVNPHYHYYTVDALLAWLEAYGIDDVPTPLREVVRRAVGAPPLLAYSDHLLPAYGDGWPDTPISNFARHAETAGGLLGGHDIDLAAYYADGHRRDSPAALLWGPDQVTPGSDRADTTPGSFCWPGSGVALLRSPAARIVLRCGPYAGGHDHNDKLAIDLETGTGWRSLDLGTSGYGADFTRWMRSPAAHSTAFVGGRPQPVSSGRITSFTATPSGGKAVGEVSWDGTRMRRTIELADDGWSDTLEADLDRADEITWVLHGDGAVVSVPAGVPAGTPPGHLADLGIGWLTELRELEPDDGRLYVTWQVAGAPDAVITVPAGFRCWAGEGPGNPSGLPLGTVVISGYAPSAAVTGRFTLA